MLRSLLCTALLASLALAWPQQGDPAPGPTTVIVTDYDRLLAAHLEALGGLEALSSLKALKFTIAASVFEQPDGAEPDAEPVEVPAQVVSVEMELGQKIPRQRHEKELDGLPLVQIVGPEGPRVWIDGKESSLPSLQQAALEQAALLSLHFSEVIGLTSGELTGSMDRVRTRDGVAYKAVEARFHPTRGVESPLRLYLHPDTLLIERVDIFDAETKRRIQTVQFSGYQDVGGLFLPALVDFLDREGRIELRWRFSEMQLNPELEPTRFELP
jgi:hypothetical protein